MGKEAFQITTRDNNSYEITPHTFQDTGLKYYTLEVEGQGIAIIGNPDFLKGGPLLVTYDPMIHKEISLPYDFPIDIDISELEEIASAIENHFL